MVIRLFYSIFVPNLELIFLSYDKSKRRREKKDCRPNE